MIIPIYQSAQIYCKMDYTVMTLNLGQIGLAKHCLLFHLHHFDKKNLSFGLFVSSPEPKAHR